MNERIQKLIYRCWCSSLKAKKLQQRKTNKKQKFNLRVNILNKYCFTDELLKKTYTRFMTHYVIMSKSNQRKLSNPLMLGGNKKVTHT